MLGDDMIMSDVNTSSNPMEKLHQIYSSSPSTWLRQNRVRQQVREFDKIGRNEPCPCGSGKKYKHCCLNTNNYEQYISK